VNNHTFKPSKTTVDAIVTTKYPSTNGQDPALEPAPPTPDSIDPNGVLSAAINGLAIPKYLKLSTRSIANRPSTESMSGVKLQNKK
jgi:hypothetical protein